jgi:hypothetical protein
MDVIMTEIRDMRRRWGGTPDGFRSGDIWYTIQPSPEAAIAGGACGYEG